jgi:PIN domain nuclease of toxin-antitoxin system
MKLLLDTHILIWLVEGDSSLSSIAKQSIEDPENSPNLSIASLWGITIKLSLGKLYLQIPLEQVVENYIVPSGIEILPVHLNHLLSLRELPLHHRDPFDRILISQAMAENMTLVSSDRAFSNYSVPICW